MPVVTPAVTPTLASKVVEIPGRYVVAAVVLLILLIVIIKKLREDPL